MVTMDGQHGETHIVVGVLKVHLPGERSNIQQDNRFLGAVGWLKIQALCMLMKYDIQY